MAILEEIELFYKTNILFNRMKFHESPRNTKVGWYSHIGWIYTKLNKLRLFHM